MFLVICLLCTCVLYQLTVLKHSIWIIHKLKWYDIINMMYIYRVQWGNCRLNHSLLRITGSPANLSNCQLVQFLNCRCYPCLQFSFRISRSFVVSFLNRASLMIIQKITIWIVRRSDVRVDVVVEILSQPRLDTSAFVAWHRVLLPNVGSSSSCPLDPS